MVFPQIPILALSLLYKGKQYQKGNNLMFGNIGASEILVIILLILVFFGTKKIPETAKNFAKGIKEFKNEINSIKESVKPIKK